MEDPLVYPAHLEPAIERLERFESEPFRFVFSVPPRHSKTETLLHFLVWCLWRNPRLNTLYCTFAAEQAEVCSKRALAIAQAVGIEFKSTAVAMWQTSRNRYNQWTGINGSITGKGYQLICVDDPVKNRVEAESPVMREKTWDAWLSDLRTRFQPSNLGGNRASFVCIQTRWHPDDLAGRLTDTRYMKRPMESVNIPAIIDEESERERPLWPEMFPLEELKLIRDDVGSYAWGSLYQGNPRPRGTSVFNDPSFYSTLPLHCRPAQGLDLAFTEKKTADWSVVVTMLLVRLKDPGTGSITEYFYVRRVVRRQLQAPDFKTELRRERQRYLGAPIRWYAAGTEKGVAQFLSKPDHVQGGRPLPGITRLQVLDPVGDKYTRAIPFAAAWNAGRVLLPGPELVDQDPAEYGWGNTFLDELRAFTGVKDAHDDQVDAAVAAFDVLATSSVELKPLSPEQREALARRM